MVEEKKQDKQDEKEIKLKVVEALQDDAYKGIARIDAETLRKLDLKRGDIITVKGAKETVATVDRAYPADIGQSIIRIDGITRKNAKISIGEIAKIKKADVKEAKKVTIAPAQKNIMIQGDGEMLKQSLLGRAFVKGDILVLNASSRGKDMMGRKDMFDDAEDIFPGFSDIMKNFGGMGLGMGGLQRINFIVVSTNPSQPVVIEEGTELIISPKAIEVSEEKISDVTYEDIGGLSEEVRKIREMVEIPLKHPELFERLGIEPPRGVLLYGPPGTGKTLLAKAVANETEANFIELNSTNFMSALPGTTERNIKKIFDDAERLAPSIVFIDELDSIAFKREERGINEFLNTPVMELLKQMDGLKQRKNVIIIGATNRPEAIDPALRRPGRFDREIEINVPNREGRLAILKIHTRNMPLAKDVNLDELARITPGFVGADLTALAKEAAMSVLRRILPSINLKEDEELPKNILENLKIMKIDFEDAIKIVQPSALREILVETPNIKWDDIGGLKNVKQELKDAVEWPMKCPECFSRMGIRAPKGILLYGPPGTGKTLLAKAVANETEANFINIKGPELINAWLGKTEEGIRKIFKRARQTAPCIIFFDEIDSLAVRRSMDSRSEIWNTIINTLLTEMDGLEELKGVLVIGATNRPDMLDPAILRPGRFDRLVLIPVPDVDGRISIFKIHTKNMPVDETININQLAKETEGYTGADIESLCREAGMLALREDKNAKLIKLKHFEMAMQKIPPSVTKQQASMYNRMEFEYLKSAKASLENPVYMG
jgi:transitional endoplasmic reticulum ATPase